MNTVSELPDELQELLQGRDVIVFDAVCVLCSRFFRFVLKHDKQARFSFATAQSDVGASLYAALGLPSDEFDTNLVIINGNIYQRLDAFNHAMIHLGGIWPLLSVARILPKRLKDFLYYRIARNRYRLFGKFETCMIPDKDVKACFLPNGFTT